MSQRDNSQTISDLKKIKILADPLRQKILSAFVHQPRTTKQAAEFLGLKPTNLYHHVDLLEKHGFLELVSTNQKRGTTEKYFKATASRFEVGLESLQGDISQSVMEQMLRGSINETLDDLRRLPSGQEANVLSMAGIMYLTDEELTSLRSKIIELSQVDPSKDRTNRKPYRILSVLAPTSVETGSESAGDLSEG